MPSALLLQAHHADVWAIAPSRTGSFLVSAAKDRSLRLWRRGDEQVFVEEEREAELEQVGAVLSAFSWPSMTFHDLASSWSPVTS